MLITSHLIGHEAFEKHNENNMIYVKLLVIRDRLTRQPLLGSHAVMIGDNQM